MREDEIEMIRTLRDRGYAVVVFNYDELKGLDPKRVEDDLVTFGNEHIHNVAEAEQDE